MLLDTSAIICAISDEPEFEKLALLIEAAPFVAVGAPVLVEAGLVLAGRGSKSRQLLAGFQSSVNLQILDFRTEHQVAALDAFLRFGKGRHPARLNFGDCLSYAYAAVHKFPLAYKGSDFGLTDLPNLHRLDA